MPSSPFWSAYGSALKAHLGAVGTHDEVFALPFTASFTDATAHLTDERVNYLLYNLANTTLASDGSTGSYATELSAYLKTALLDSHQDREAKEELCTAEKEMNTAQIFLKKTKKEAEEAYDEDSSPDKPPFDQWASINYPEYGVAIEQLSIAEGNYHQAYDYYYGPGFDELQKHRKSVAKALDTTNNQPSYNMSVRKDGGNLTFAPYYRSNGLEHQLNDWIKKGGKEETLFEVKVDDASPPGTKSKQGIYLKLTTKGIYKSDIDLGRWDVPDVKTLYPKQTSGAPKVLDPKYARPITFLLAYDPKLEMEIKESPDENVKSNKFATSTASDNGKPYVAVLGVVGRHFAA